MAVGGGVLALKQGDYVRTVTGEVGKIVYIDRLTAFVSFPTSGKTDDMRAFLLSTLTLVNASSTEPDRTDHSEGTT